MKIVPDGTLSVLCLELAELMKAGITVPESFLLLSEEAGAGMKPALYGIYEKTDRGERLSLAIEEAGIFPPHMVKMIRVAEETGALEDTCRALGAYYHGQERLKKDLKRTLGYPMLLLLVVGLVYMVFLTEVLPIFDAVFRSVGGELQGISRVFLNIGLSLSRVKWLLLAVFLCLAAVAGAVYFVPACSEKAGKIFSKLFAGTKTARILSRARFASALSLAVSGGRELRHAMSLALEFAGDNAAIQQAAQDVEDGMNLSEAAARHSLFAPMYCRMLKVGEHSGAVDTLMAEAARRMEEEAEDALSKLSGAVEPAVVAVLTLGVGLLLLSVMLPLVGILSAL